MGNDLVANSKEVYELAKKEGLQYVDILSGISWRGLIPTFYVDSKYESVFDRYEEYDDTCIATRSALSAQGTMAIRNGASEIDIKCAIIQACLPFPQTNFRYDYRTSIKKYIETMVR